MIFKGPFQDKPFCDSMISEVSSQLFELLCRKTLSLSLVGVPVLGNQAHSDSDTVTEVPDFYLSCSACL